VDTLHRFFPSFRLDARNAQLWGGDHEIDLRRKTVDVLLYLVDHPGQTAQCERLTRNPFVDRVQEDPTACFPSKGFFAQVQSEFYWTKGQWTKGPFHNAMQERNFDSQTFAQGAEILTLRSRQSYRNAPCTMEPYERLAAIAQEASPSPEGRDTTDAFHNSGRKLPGCCRGQERCQMRARFCAFAICWSAMG
jgi:hypothetical protein